MPSIRRLLTVERVEDSIERSSPVNSFKLKLPPHGQISVIARCDDGSEISNNTGSVWIKGKWVWLDHGNKYIDNNDFFLTTVAPSLAEKRAILWDQVVDNILSLLSG
jgi:hypothetical protein